MYMYLVRIRDMPITGEIVTYCTYGTKSLMATHELRLLHRAYFN